MPGCLMPSDQAIIVAQALELRRDTRLLVACTLELGCSKLIIREISVPESAQPCGVGSTLESIIEEIESILRAREYSWESSSDEWRFKQRGNPPVWVRTLQEDGALTIRISSVQHSPFERLEEFEAAFDEIHDLLKREFGNKISMELNAD